MTNFESKLDLWRSTFNDALATVVSSRYLDQAPVSHAVRYALEAGGKRVRPILTLMTNAALGGQPNQAMGAAIAVEFVHTYSLVHDDLPCMDDDDLRRGKPTTHKVHGEAQALLAGDALLTDAFDILASGTTGIKLPDSAIVAMVRELARAAGGHGMVLGQSLDLYWTARLGASRQDLDGIHHHKTGRLLGSSAALGAIAAGASQEVVERLRKFGDGLGLAFQILDDLLDESHTTGKSAGKDRETGKLTYLTLMSQSEARQAAASLSQHALAQLNGIVPSDGDLAAFASWLLGRTS